MKGVVVHSSLALPWLRSTFNYYFICQAAKAGTLMVKVKPYQPIQFNSGAGHLLTIKRQQRN